MALTRERLQVIVPERTVSIGPMDTVEAPHPYDYKSMKPLEFRQFMERYEDVVIQRKTDYPIWPMWVSHFQPGRISGCVGLRAYDVGRVFRDALRRQVIRSFDQPVQHGNRVFPISSLDQDRMRVLGTLLYVAKSKLNEGRDIRVEDIVPEAKELLRNDPLLLDLLYDPKSAQTAVSKEEETQQGVSKRKYTRREPAEESERIVILSPEDEELRGKIPLLTREQEEDIGRYNRDRLLELLERIPKDMFSVDFTRLQVPEYVAQILLFIYAVHIREAPSFDLVWYFERMNNTVLRNAVKICIEEYFDKRGLQLKKPLEDLFRLYRFAKLDAKDQIREAKIFDEE